MVFRKENPFSQYTRAEMLKIKQNFVFSKSYQTTDKQREKLNPYLYRQYQCLAIIIKPEIIKFLHS